MRLDILRFSRAKAAVLLCFAFMALTFQASAADVAIDQHNKQFIPDQIAIKTGDTLVFHNRDSIKHNIEVVDSDGTAEDKGLQKPDTTIRHTFTKPGKYQVRCTIHPEMIMNIVVQ